MKLSSFLTAHDGTRQNIAPLRIIHGGAEGFLHWQQHPEGGAAKDYGSFPETDMRPDTHHRESELK